MVRRRMMSSELDLNTFERTTVEDHISSIIERLYDDPILRKRFGLKGRIKFENHSNTLHPEEQIAANMQDLSLWGRRQSPRLLARAATPAESSGVVEGSAQESKLLRPRADQFCVYHISNISQDTETRIAAFIVEYKPPHKLTLGCIYEGLDEMDLEEVVCSTAGNAKSRAGD